MKFKLPRPKFTPLLIKVIERELKKQKDILVKVTPKALEQLAQMVGIIKRRGLPPYLVHKKLPDPMGWGIFLHPKAKPLLRGQLISSYAGKVGLSPQNMPDESAYAFEPIDKITLKKEEQAELDPKRIFSSQRQYALGIDALKEGNFTRFINHSEKPNIEARILAIPKNKLGLDPSPIEVLYFVKKKVLPGQQLLTSYEEGEAGCYWKVLNIKPEPVFPSTFTLDAQLKLIDHRKK
jgi:hypothetical protein